MNAYKYLNSRLGKTIELLKKAYLSDRHICFLVCSEPEFITEVINSASLFPNNKASEKSTTEPYVKFVNDGNFIKSSLRSSNDKNSDNQPIDRPQLFVYKKIYDKNKKLNEDIDLPLDSLINYVDHTTTMSHCNYELSASERQKLTNLKDSLILIPVNSRPQIPSYIKPYSETIVVPFMDEYEFKEYVSLYLKDTEKAETTINHNGYIFLKNEEFLTGLYHNMRGLNATQIKMILRKNQLQFGRLYMENPNKKQKELFEDLKRNIRKEFERIIETSRALTLEGSSTNEPAGLKNMTIWLDKHKRQVSEPHAFRRFILEAPKGLLVSGIPGTGKSMMAKYIAGCFGLSLVRLDFGNLGGGLVGESEKNMDNALSMIEAISPCVLWVDEMEKAFSGSKGNSGHETTKRLIGKFLTWMQEKGDKGVSCFVFATANDISQMPPEMFRSGRFDEKFFTFMPTAEECGEIFHSIIKKECEDYEKINANNIQAKPLFNKDVINKELFIKLINSDICLPEFKNDLDYRKVNRLNKFFIGADIAQVIKKAKNLYLICTPYNSIENKEINNSEDIKRIRKVESSKDATFDSDKFIECLKIAIKEIKSYGETNLDDIAKCYAQLAVNNFSNASSGCILPFEGYDELSYISKKKDEDIYIYDLNRNNKDGETEHYKKNLGHNYDKCLYIIVRNAINQLAEEIIRKRRGL